jgi:SAM-dependent methyltransferase
VQENNRQIDNQAIYDAGWTDWLDMKRYGPASRWLRFLIARACRHLVPPPASILDVGCGEGTTTAMLAEMFPRATVKGVDFSATAIDVARRHLIHPNLTYAHEPAMRGDVEQADMICCFEVLEHVDEWHSFLGRLAAAAVRYILLSFPTGRMRPFEVNVGHLRNFQKGEVEGELGRLGFRPLTVSYAGFPFYSPLYRELCQLTNAGDNSLTRGSYSPYLRAVSYATYMLFRFASTRQRFGDQFVGLFAVDRSSLA